MSSLQNYFEKFRKNIIGNDFVHEFPSGRKKIIYADWAASGRLYSPIEDYITNKLGPYVANTHTETSLTGTVMTSAYHQAQQIIKEHVNASENDALLFDGFGMTAVVNKFQRILGLKIPEQFRDQVKLKNEKKPLVILTHMEHHSNQTTWIECFCDVELILRKEDGLPDLQHLEEILESNTNRELIIGSFTACSNVTGIFTPFHEMAEIVHKYGGYCFIDFSASAAYVEMNMHPDKKEQRLDAIFFSPHKFLGGPGSSGVIVFNKELYKNVVPDQPGGGTVLWTNPWGDHRFFDDIEVREDGGTPGFLQAIKTGLVILIKEEMEIEKIAEREHELKDRLFDQLQKIDSIFILEPQQRDRLGYISFYTIDKHYNLIVKLLNDKFGIQTRGGCSCAGTYGHLLLGVDQEKSKEITCKIDQGDLSDKPGWVRISIHPTMTNNEIDTIAFAVDEVIKHYEVWEKEYDFDPTSGEFNSLKKDDFFIDLKSTFKCL